MRIPFELVLFDLETTDQSMPGEPEIVEIGAIFVDRGLDVKEKFSSLVKPAALENFTDFSEDFTGISRRMLEKAEDWVHVQKKFVQITKHNRHRLSSWGISSDLALLKNSYGKCGIRYPHHKTPICMMSYVAGILSERGICIKGLGLKGLCEQFEVQKPIHRALPDAEAMLELLRKLMFDLGGESEEAFRLYEV